MGITFEALALMVVLLPGFLSSSLLDHVIVRKPKDHFGKVVEALVLSFVIYAVVVGLVGVPAFQVPTSAAEVSTAASELINQRFVWLAFGLALLLPLVLGLLASTDLHMKFLRWIRVTNKTARETTWLDVFSDQKRYVVVNLSGQRRIFGWPMYFSNDREEGLLFLQDPAWVDDDGTHRNLDVHGIFLVEPGSIESIEFTHLDEQRAKILPQIRNGSDQDD